MIQVQKNTYINQNEFGRHNISLCPGIQTKRTKLPSPLSEPSTLSISFLWVNRTFWKHGFHGAFFFLPAAPDPCLCVWERSRVLGDFICTGNPGVGDCAINVGAVTGVHAVLLRLKSRRQRTPRLPRTLHSPLLTLVPIHPSESLLEFLNFVVICCDLL